MEKLKTPACEGYLDAGYASRNYPGEKCCGDQVGHWALSCGSHLICLIDGIGHGPLAYQASSRCLDVVDKNKNKNLSNILEACNEELLGTRGVAVSLALVQPFSGLVSYCGVGNVECFILGRTVKHLNNNYGILGNEFDLQLSVDNREFHVGDDILIMHSDGIRTNIPLEKHARNLFPNMNGMARWIVEHWSKDKDDASVVVIS